LVGIARYGTHFVALKRWVNKQQVVELAGWDIRQVFAANLRRLRHAKRLSQDSPRPNHSGIDQHDRGPIAFRRLSMVTLYSVLAVAGGFIGGFWAGQMRPSPPLLPAVETAPAAAGTPDVVKAHEFAVVDGNGT
jgi:hypothetical protein